MGEISSAGRSYPNNTFASGTYTLLANGELDQTFAQKGYVTTGYYGRYYFTYTPYNYVFHAFSTSGNPQLMTAPAAAAVSTANVVRYSFAPENNYNKNVFDTSGLWEDASQNFTYYRNPCWLGRYTDKYGSTEYGHPAFTTNSTPGWQQGQFGGTLICPHNTYNMEVQDSFRPGWTSGYPATGDVGAWTEMMVDGRMNFPGNGTPPGADDTYYVDRHNSLLDYKHSDDFNSVLEGTSELNQNQKQPNTQPWYCQISTHSNKSFCVMTSSLSTLVYNVNPGGGLGTTTPWSAYWSSAKELSSFRTYFNRRYFNTGTWNFSFDHLMEISLYPTLAQNEILYSNMLYVSNDSQDYETFFRKQFPQAEGSLDQNQFLLKDWENAVFFIFDEETRIYSPGIVMNVTGLVMRNGNKFSSQTFALKIYKNDGTLVQTNDSLTTNASGFFNISLILPTSMAGGLHYIEFNYNNGEFKDTMSFMMTNLIATITNNKAAYERGEIVQTSLSIEDSLTEVATDPSRLVLQYINATNYVVGCAKYPGNASVVNCNDNLTKTGTGLYDYNFSLGTNPLGTYTVKTTVTDSADISADYTTQFVVALIDACKPNFLYNYASAYPMFYNQTTGVLTVIGNSSMGTSNNPITFNQIYEFAQVTNGTCIIEKPATGTFSVKKKLVIGNGTQEVYIESKGESIGFSSSSMPQLFVNKSAHLIFGGIVNGIPQEGCSIKFTSNSDNNLLIDVAGGEIAFYDSYISDVGVSWGRFMYRGTCGVLEEETSDVNSTIIIKKSIFDRAARGQFFFTGNVTIDDMKLNRVNSSASEGYGVVSGCSLPSLNNLQIYHQEQAGAGIFIKNNTPANTDLIITSSTLDYNIKDVIANKDGRGIQLINTQWDRTYGFNYSDSWEGTTTIKESYGYRPSFEDSLGIRNENVSITATDIFGNVYLDLLSNSSGEIPEQSIPTWQVQKTSTSEEVVSFNPYRVRIKQYGKNYITETKSFLSRTIETKQLGDNNFVVTPVATLLVFGNISYIPPSKIDYGDEVNSSWELTGQLNNYPVDSCQYTALFANGTKLTEVIDYVLNYQTGSITFTSNMSGYEIKPTYYSGGNITLTNGLTSPYSLDEIYDWMQYNTYNNNLSEELTTADGINYNFCIDLFIGNSTNPGYIQSAQKAVVFNTGYDLRFISGKVDLAGVGGSGSVHYIEVAKPEIKAGRTQGVYMSLTNNIGQPLSGKTIRADVHYPNGSKWLSDQYFEEYIEGMYRMNFVIPSTLRPYGIYTISLKDSYSTVRTFNLVPSSDIVVRGPPASSGDYFSWIDARIFDAGLWIEAQGTVVNNLDEEIILSQTDLYEGNYFIPMLKDFETQSDTWYISELNTSTRLVNNSDLSNMSLSGDILGMSFFSEGKPYPSNNNPINLTINFTGGNKVINLKLNFTTLNINYSFWDEETNFVMGVRIHSDYYDQSIDGNVKRIAVKMMTDENNYYIQNTTLRYWQVQSPNVWNELQPYYDGEFVEIVGNPDPTNISSCEFIIYSQEYPLNDIVEIDLYDPLFDRYKTLRDYELGKKSQGGYNTLFWWDSDGTYTLTPNQERKFFVGTESPYLHAAEIIEIQYPEDSYVIEKMAAIRDAQLYWEQVAAYESLISYIRGNPGQNIFLLSSMGSSYSRSDESNIDMVTYNRLGNLVSANVSVNVTYPNKTSLSFGQPIEINTGRYNYNFVIPSNAPEGDYSVLIESNYSTYNSTDVQVFRVSTSTSGGGGSTPSIQLDAPSVINTNTNFGIYTFTRDNSSLLVDCDSGASLTLKDSLNGTIILNDASMTKSATGQYNYTTSLPYQSTFLATVSCSIDGTSYLSNPKIISSQDVPGGGGSAYPTIEILSSTPIATATLANIGALVKSSNGIITDCDGDLNITMRNLIDGTSSSGIMNKFGTGMYNYSWTTPVTASVFYVNSSCLISGTEYTGFTVLSTQALAATATIDYNQIAQYVWSYTSRNLTYYNQSVAENLQACLKDAACSNWWINTTLSDINSTINRINSTANQIKTNTETILSYINCTSANEVCTILQNILGNTTDIQSRVYSLNTSQIPAIQGDIDNIYIDTQYIKTNMATASNLANIENNITWLVNNVATQANLTLITQRLDVINSTVNTIRTQVNCSDSSNSALCGYLNSINTTVNTIYSEMLTSADLSNIQNNLTWLIGNVATQEALNNNFTDIRSRLTNMNTTLLNVHNNLTSINTTLANQITNAQGDITWVRNNVATSAEIQSNFSETFSRLANINLTVVDTNNYLEGEVTTRLNELNATTQESYSYLLNNLSIATNLTEVLNQLDDLSNNITFVKNNMFYQGNATGSFLVDYLSSVYVEQGNRAETWIVTTDLLGNAKTVSVANCQIEKAGTFIDNAVTTISSGGVHAYWEIPSNQVPGSYYFNCTLTGSTLNLMAPFFVSSSPFFTITDLVAASPKYPNENAIVEATFATKNGSAIPDTINMTIWKPNYLTVWHTADKEDFEVRNGIWYWTQMIESIPTTGAYYVNMKATYNGHEDSRTTQFRIATGGPYKVYLECPTSSNVGSNLVCTLIINDEGEAETESISTIWVDTNNNAIVDTGEPQTSFSKETKPLQNISEAVSINVPSSQTTGYFVVRVKTSYVNSVQPDSTASDSVTLQTSGEVTPPEERKDGGGGGGGGSTPANKSSPITGNIISPPEYSIEVLIRVLEDYRIIDSSSNNKILAEITFLNLGIEGNKSALFTYCVNDNNDLVVECVNETVAVQKKIQLVKKITLPSNIEEGIYTVIVKVDYMNETVESRETFEVRGEEKPIIFSTPDFSDFKLNENYIVLAIIGLLATIAFVLTLVLISKRRSKHRAITAIESNLQQLKELKAKKEIKPITYHFEREKLLEKIKNVYQGRAVSAILFGIGIVALVMLFINAGLTGYAVGESVSAPINSFIHFFFLIGAFGLLMFIHRKKIRGGTEKIGESFRKKHPCNSLKGLVNKKVYSEKGNYIGKIKDILLEEKKIGSLKIKIDKKHKFKAKGIVIDYKHVRNVGEVIIIDTAVSEHLENYKDSK